MFELEIEYLDKFIQFHIIFTDKIRLVISPDNPLMFYDVSIIQNPYGDIEVSSQNEEIRILLDETLVINMESEDGIINFETKRTNSISESFANVVNAIIEVVDMNPQYFGI